jgi:hypothetical protein
MPKRAEERQAVEAVCRLFNARLGSSWDVVPGPAPDEAHREEKAPDALISDGKITAAVEVTQLTGGETLHRYLTSKPALERELTKALPESFQGTLWICPPDGFALPVTRELVTQLQRLVAEVAPTVSAENPQSYIRFPMMGWLSKTRNNHHTEWLCRHSRSQFHIVLERKSQPGIYYLYDECDYGLWSHPEVEDENMLLDSISSLIEAAASIDNNDRQQIQWHDLWPVIFVPSAPRNVSVLAISKVYSLPDSAQQDVSSAIQRKISKFSERSWADLHVLALVVPFQQEQDYLLKLREDLPELVDLGNLDVVVAVYQGEASLLWQREAKLRGP